jgi:hypothetical protein
VYVLYAISARPIYVTRAGTSEIVYEVMWTGSATKAPIVKKAALVRVDNATCEAGWTKRRSKFLKSSAEMNQRLVGR